MFFKSKGFQLGLALALGAIVLMLPRPEGTRFKITGDAGQKLIPQIEQNFTLVSTGKDKSYVVEAKTPGSTDSTAAFLKEKVESLPLKGVEVSYINGLSPKAMRFLAVLAVLIFLFIIEPIPL
ncbi:MAG: anion transporter, partial [Desulfobulbaceae bacterium]|nr:anion transporter [Desulfobulbaceae bacterium]